MHPTPHILPVSSAYPIFHYIISLEQAEEMQISMKNKVE